jgi:MoxR-like ATPase
VDPHVAAGRYDLTGTVRRDQPSDRGYVTPEDVKAIGPDVLRHRMVLSYEAEAEEVTAEQFVKRVFEVVEVP